MSRQVLLDQTDRVADWVAGQLDVNAWLSGYKAIGLEEDGEVIAGVVYTRYIPGVSMEGAIAAIPGRRWLTRPFLRAIFSYPFEQLGLRRLTTLAEASNVDSIRFTKKLGFIVEGLVRCGAENGDHLVVFGMLREECPWLTRLSSERHYG